MAKNPKQQAAIAISMKKTGKTPKRKMKAGGKKITTFMRRLSVYLSNNGPNCFSVYIV